MARDAIRKRPFVKAATPDNGGLLLGYALLTKFIFSHNAQAAQRGEQIRAAIVPYQTVLGYVAIVLGLWTIVATFLYRI